MTPKSDPRNPKRKSPNISKRPASSSSSCSPSSFSSSSLASLLPEPSPNLFPSVSELLQLVAAIAVAVSVAAGCHYMVTSFNRLPKPFCNSDSEFDDSISNSCEPCPRNGQCYDGHLECAQGYRKYSRICVEDGVGNEAAKKISEGLEDHLCQEYAQFLCDGKGLVWVSEDQLKDEMDIFWQRNNLGLDNASYKYVKERALDHINVELDTRINDRRMKEFKCPDNVAEEYKNTICRLRQWIANHSLILMPVSALLVSCIIILLRVRRRWYLSKRAEQLYHQVCDILEENALMSKGMDGGELWLVASRLRDHLLSPRERRDTVLWKKVIVFYGASKS
ncbi:hypothetical protein Dimus_008500 [Dionaea muscipula]